MRRSAPLIVGCVLVSSCYVGSWPANFKKAGGTLTLSAGASAVDVIKMRWEGTNWREVSRALNLS